MKRLLLLSLVSFAFIFAKGQALQLQRPVKGDVWPAFSIQRIQWQFANVDNIKIEVSADSARTWTVVQASYPASATFYNWTVINKPSDSCYIRISDVSNPTVQSSNYPGNPFIIPKPALLLDNVAATVYGGTALPITWTATGTQTIRLLASYNNGQSYSLIANNILATSGYYNWVAKDTAAAKCYILIQSVDNASIADTTDNSFVISKLPGINGMKYKGGSYDGHTSASNKAKSIKVLSPNGKEQLTPNNIFPVTFSSTSINSVNIKYSIDSGKTWLNLITAYPASSASYNWTVPATPSTKCFIKISDAADTTVFDVSDTAFTIKSNSLKLTAPAENEIAYRGQALPIAWTSLGISKINITYQDGSVLKTISTGVNAANEVFNWTVQTSISDSVKIRIADFDNPSTADSVMKVYIKSMPAVSVAKYRGGSYDGHATASNKAAYITLLTPNSNIKIAPATQYNITWSSFGIAKVDLALSADSGKTWQTIINALANADSYLWTVPSVPSTKCLVRVRNSADTTVTDMSDVVFTISSKSITLTTDTATIRYSGTAMPLEWDQQGIATVKLEYKTTAKEAYKIIKDQVPATNGIYNWVTPSFSTDTLWVKISDYSDASASDEKTFKKVFKSLPGMTGEKYKGGSFDGHSSRSNINKINITKPAANYTLTGGTTYAISWSNQNLVDSINLQYSLDSGKTWTSIGKSSPLNGQYNWVVPSSSNGRYINANTVLVSDLCQVRAIQNNEEVGKSNRTFSIIASGSVLPVDIFAFKGNLEGSIAKLEWKAANEIGFDRFEIERSLDGIVFTKVGQVKGSSLSDYNFADYIAAFAGKRVYYRLKKVDKDGLYKYSEVISFIIASNNQFTVYPIPAKAYLVVQFDKAISGKATVELSDMQGKLLLKQPVVIGGNSFKLNLPSVSSGTYILKVLYKGEQYIQKVLVDK